MRCRSVVPLALLAVALSACTATPPDPLPALSTTHAPTVVTSVRITSDSPERGTTGLPGPLSPEDAEAIAARIAPDIAGLRGVSSDSGFVDVAVIWDDGTIQEQLTSAYGEGVAVWPRLIETEETP